MIRSAQLLAAVLLALTALANAQDDGWKAGRATFYSTYDPLV